MSTRRLPVYLVLDCSESMAGSAIEEVARGVDSLVTALKSNPLALETVYLSVITFSRYAKQVVPLTELISFQPPTLSVRPGTALGSAIQLLMNCMSREVSKTSPTTKGDYRPLVFLLTDGQPTDDWHAMADAIRAANNPRIANIYAIGCGPDVDPDNLREITDVVLSMPDMSPDAFRKAFVWLSASISTASTRLGKGDGTASIDMPTLPEGVLEFSTGGVRHDPTPRQVFLQSRCQRTAQPYLMRFARQGSFYVAIASHPLDELEQGDGDLLPPISSSQLSGCPSCPYCENQAATVCPCGSIFCDSSEQHGPVVCPHCQSELMGYTNNDSFDIRTSEG
jgi:uncharacterized protein YegL